MALASWDEAISFVLLYEGGFADNPHDPGGPTKYGIDISTLSHEMRRRATIEDVKTLSLATAKNIYQLKYWNVIDGNSLPAGVDVIAMDICVNSGLGRILPWLHETQMMGPHARINELDRYRRGFWRRLRIFRYFGRGWLRRENACLALAMKMLNNRGEIA